MGRQFSYGSLVGERKKTRPAKESWLAGLSASGSLSTLSWAATGYGYDNQAVGETRLTLPLGEAINVNLQNMLASDSSWSSVGSISATLPGALVQCGSTRREPTLAINCGAAMPITGRSAAPST
jgi:hypothetical protein